MEITLNGLNLNTGWYKVEDIQFDSSPPLEFSDMSFASDDGAKFITSKFTPKTLTVSGRITHSSVAGLEAEMDNFKKTLLLDSNISLNFSYAGNFRQYVGNVQNLTLTRKHFNITYCPFEITFVAGDPPFAYEIDALSSTIPTLNEVFSSDAIIGNTYSHTLSMSGTAPPLAKWTYLLDAVSGTVEQVVFKSLTTGKQMEINSALSAGDEIVINQEELQVMLNSMEREYEGVFPAFNLGGNEFEFQIYGTGGTSSSGFYLDQSQVIATSYYYVPAGQTFTAGYTGTLGKISIGLKRRDVTLSGTIIYLDLYSTSTGVPTLTKLATSSNYLDISTLPVNETVWFDFTFNYSITSGTVYAWAVDLSRLGSWATVIYGGSSSTYSGGSGYMKWSSKWDSYSNLDFCFKTYVTANIANAFDHTSSIKIEQKKRFL